MARGGGEMAARVWWQKTQQRRIKSTLGDRNSHRAWRWPRSQEKTGHDKVGQMVSGEQHEEGNWPVVVLMGATAVQSWGRKLGHLLKTK